jgi:hypothetical protein
LPAGDPRQDRVELPEPPVIVVGESVQTRFVEFVVTERVTVPLKPFTGATVMVELPMPLEFTVTVVGLAVMVKSWMGSALI